MIARFSDTLTKLLAKSKTDWILLIFLLLFLNVKLYIKVAAIILIYLLRPDFSFGFNLKHSRLPLFYPFLIGIALLNAALNLFYRNPNYVPALATGIGFWVICILTIHQLKLSVEKNDLTVVHRTLLLFFVINLFVSFINYGMIVWETGTLNPFQYQANYQKYFINTGDYIKGISFDTSTTNAIINAAGMIYFLFRKNLLLFVLCNLAMLLTASNLTNIPLSAIFIFLFIFRTTREQKSFILISLMLLAVFMIRISPQNNRYLAETYRKNIQKDTTPERIIIIKDTLLTKKPDSILTPGQLKEKIAMLYLDSISAVIERENKTLSVSSLSAALLPKSKPFIPRPNIHTAYFQKRDDTSEVRKQLINFIRTNKIETARIKAQETTPGKIIALQQLVDYFRKHPLKAITGAGMGNFSSKLAFRTTCLQIAGGYPQKFLYINQDFKDNHLAVYINYFSNNITLHSLTNSPNSVWFQIAGEYGLLGLFAFVFLYLVFFIKHIRHLSYGPPLLLLLGCVFFTDYWFEQLSIVILTELLLFLNIKETTAS